MRSKILFWLVCTVFILGSKEAVAQREWHVSSTKALEMSLGSLRQSAQEMARRNQWLISEIQALELKVEELKNPSLQVSDNLPYFPAKEPVMGQDNNREPLKPVDVNPLSQEKESSLLNRLDAKSGKEADLLKSIEVVKQNIRYLRGELGYGIESTDYMEPGQVNGLKSQLELSQRNVDQLERRLRAIEKEHVHSFKQNMSLDEKNQLLNQQISLLQERYEKAQIQEQDIKTSIKRLESQNSTFVTEMQDSIAHLKSQGKELEQVLSQASKKMEHENSSFKITDEEIEILMENLSYIEQENRLLKNRYTKLESDLERLNLTAGNR